MGLEVFDFIPDLVDTNPVGATDFVNEGDDHLRGVKFTLQNQFPNIGQNQMLLTALQLNEAAIKNESNIFTVDQIFQNSAIFDDLTGVNEINSATFRSVSITRWQTQMDAVRNYRLRRFDNAGVFVDDPWSVDAATGVVNFAQVPTIQAAPIWTAGELKLFANANTPGANWFLADGTSGTVNITDRVLMASGTSAPGTALAPNLVGTAAAGTSGAVALTIAQLPVHSHRIWSGTQSGVTDTTLSHAAANPVVGANRTNTFPAYTQNNSAAISVIENTGSGSTHSHTTPAAAVTQNGATRDTVRPLSMTVGVYQYVP